MALIYRIDCEETGLLYVGQTILPLGERWDAHIAYAKWVIDHKPEKDTHFARAIKKYGANAFVPSVIEEKRAAAIRAAGHKRSDEVKEKIRTANKGQQFSKETRAKMRTAKLGTHLKEETKKKLGRPVRQLTCDGQVVAIFDTMTAAAKATGYSKGSVCNNIRDPERWPLKDAKFEYVAR